MTDDKIKEEFENWIKGVTTQEEADFANRFHPYYMDLAQGYISGFRAAERLAKIEVLEEVRRMFDNLDSINPVDYSDSFAVIDSMLSDLKGEQ